MDYSQPGSSVHGILQARILEQVAMPSSRGSSPPRDLMSPALAASLPLIPPGKPHIADGGGGGVVTKSCPTLVTGLRVSLLGSSAHGTSQASILEWVTISLST